MAEKPSVARDLATVLGAAERKDGYLENEKYLVSWACGHLVELAEPHDYDRALIKWDLESLPIIPVPFRLKPADGAGKQLGVLKKLLHRPDVGTVVNACDAGREGELIFRRIYGFCGCRKPVRRLWLSESTSAAVRAAFANLRAGEEFDGLAAAAEARARADWLVGINATRAFSVRHSAVLSVGRVQTPTLALIVAREKEIEVFRPTPYWEVWAEFETDDGTYRGRWTAEDGDRLSDAAAAEAVARKARAAPSACVAKVEHKEVREAPPPFFNLNDLQKEANRRHGLTARQTLDAAQSLYEKHKLITYPRTDSRCVTEALARETFFARLAALARVPEFAGLVPAEPRVLGRRHVNDAGVTDHHAIIPTAAEADVSLLSGLERTVYELVVRRFLSAFHADALRAETTVVTLCAGENFVTRGRTELAPGWRRVYGSDRADVAEERDEDDEPQALPPLAEGQTVRRQKIETRRKETRPPRRYTEAGLLAAMENAGRLTDDAAAAATLKARGGIGTSATRAEIIETLIRRGYILRRKKTLVPTDRGRALVELVPEELKSVETTARWEDGLREVEEGLLHPERWLREIEKFTREVVAMAKEQTTEERVRNTRESVGHCPLCGREVLDYPKSFGCAGYRDGCGFVIWKEICGKRIGRSQARALLAKGRTGLLKGFKSKKTGKNFEAALVLNREEGKVTLEFPAARAEGGR
ncbi:MAG: DNA topoisomerase 3 [Bacillota bacterium]|nr:DNA topoisomerase 3 [Bacillota bacterium]